MNLRYGFYLLLLFVLCLPFAGANGQEKSDKKSGNFCQNNNWSNGDKVSFHELRELTLPATSLLTVDGKRNGGIYVTGENRSDILVRACVQTWGKTDEAASSLAKSIRIETGSVIQAESATDESNWSVSYRIQVPRSTNLKLTAHNGGIGISSVEGTMEFETVNGGLHLENPAGDVKGRTTNGGLHVSLSGNTWKGSGLNLETTNGGVHLSIPENYAAHLETRTVNGGFKSDINGLTAQPKDRSRNVNISTDLNGGGPTIRLVTTNGGVKIGSN